MRSNSNQKKVKEGWDNKLFAVIVTTLVLTLTAICLIPFIYLIAVSLSDANAVMRGEVFLIPKGFTLAVYKRIWETGTMLIAMKNTILLTVVYVGVSMVITVLCAYPLSVPDLKGKKVIIPFIMFTMYFSGGMIPLYLVVHGLGMIDSWASLVLPCALSTYNMIVMRSFFASIPVSLREAALIDGAGDVTILTKITLPLSKASLATIALFYLVSRWNSYMDALLYMNDTRKSVLQIRLKQMILSQDELNKLLIEGAAEAASMPAQTMRAGCLVFSLIPVLIIYPFLQKYFVKGTMIGSVKG